MKIFFVTFVLSASAVSGYNVGFETFGRPFFVSPRGRFGRSFKSYRCDPRRQGRDCVDRAFDKLRDEVSDYGPYRRPTPPPRSPSAFQMDEETIRQQEEWLNRAFGLASDVAQKLSTTPSEAKEADEAIRQQKEWVDRVFGFARDVSSGGAYNSLRSEVLQDDDQAFQIALDVPGVKVADIDVSVEGTKQKILVVRAQREGGAEGVRKFSKAITIDSRSVTDQISADLENGVLVVSVPRIAIENTESVQKVPVNKISDETSTSSNKIEPFPFEVELEVPGVVASNIDIKVEGDTDKTMTITAVRDLGNDSEGNPRKREMTRTFKVGDFVDVDKIVANLSNGVLKVTAPANDKKTEEPARSIIVKQSSDSSGPRERSQADGVEGNLNELL